MDRRHDPSVKRRGTAMLLALLYAFGAFAGLFHVATVEHERCEHGDVVHASFVEASGGPALVFDEARLVDAERGGPHGDEHDHCDVLVPQAKGALSVEAPAVSALPSLAEAPGEPAPAVVTVVVAAARYRLAPKGSPPAA